MEPVQTQFYTFEGLTLENGEWLGPITLAYETYGTLNPEKSNAILILHALSGDAHAAGWHGWWDKMIGPGRAFDTDHYFMISSNVLGGCQGSTGPSSLNPATQKPYALDFPRITIGDMVACQKKLVEFLGIQKFFSLAGGSMGGMAALSWIIQYPEAVHSAIPIATTLKHSAQQIAFNEVGRQAIQADPRWNQGHYYGHALPADGLAVARMLGHITYMSEVSMERKFGRQKTANACLDKFAIEFEVESYLRYRADHFVKRFDPNSYLYITKAIDHFDASKTLEAALKQGRPRLLVIGFESDWLYPLHQSQAIASMARLAGVEVSAPEIASTYGHDAFLLETEEQSRLIKKFLLE